MHRIIELMNNHEVRAAAKKEQLVEMFAGISQNISEPPPKDWLKKCESFIDTVHELAMFGTVALDLEVSFDMTGVAARIVSDLMYVRDRVQKLLDEWSKERIRRMAQPNRENGYSAMNPGENRRVNDHPSAWSNETGFSAMNLGEKDLAWLLERAHFVERILIRWPTSRASGLFLQQSIEQSKTHETVSHEQILQRLKG